MRLPLRGSDGREVGAGACGGGGNGEGGGGAEKKQRAVEAGSKA